MGFNANRLKVQLKLAVNRLKMLQNKKASINAQQRREIALLLEKGKEESARIRVEHIIREDYNIEAMEMMEIYCEMLLARFGLIEQMKQMDPALEEAAASIIYSAPRCEAQELFAIREQLVAKYGKTFSDKSAAGEKVNERLLRKLKIQVPAPKLVTSYLVEIAKNYNVAWNGGDEDLEFDSSLLGDSFDLSLPAPPAAAPAARGPGGGSSKPGPGPGPGSGPGFSSWGAPAPSAKSTGTSAISSASSSMLDELFPSVPSSARLPPPTDSKPPPHFDEPDFPDKEDDEGDEPKDDGDAPDFDELTKRFEALKKRN